EQGVDELATRVRLTLSEAQVLEHRELGEDFAVFGNVADAELNDLVRARLVDARTREAHLAPALDEPQDALDRARLAHTVATEQSGHAGGGDREADIFDDLLAGDTGAEPAHRQNRGITSAGHTVSPR